MKTPKYTYGIQDVSKRLKTFKNRAETCRLDADQAILHGEYLAKKCRQRAEEHDAAAKKLLEVTDRVNKRIKELESKGLKAVDAKRGLALKTRGLTKVTGLTHSQTELFCSGDNVGSKSMYWAEAWIVDALDGLSKSAPNAVVSKFYERMQELENREDIESAAGLWILKHRNK